MISIVSYITEDAREAIRAAGKIKLRGTQLGKNLVRYYKATIDSLAKGELGDVVYDKLHPAKPDSPMFQMAQQVAKKIAEDKK